MTQPKEIVTPREAPAVTAETLAQWIRRGTLETLHRRGAVLGLSGGIDSSVVAALAVRALGPKRVVGVALPERESSGDSIELARELADGLGIELLVEDITGGLEGMGAYRRRDEAIRRLFEDFDGTEKVKLTLDAEHFERTGLNVFKLTLVGADGSERSKRPSLRDYLQIVAASNFKQRLRMTMLYHHAELRNYAVLGTGNRNEHDQGFFVKFGDGGADLKPILHLFKTEVYALAEELAVPASIVSRPPTTDTYSAEVTQEEFFFRVPFETLDAVWSGLEAGRPLADVAAAAGLTEDDARAVLEDLRQKHRTTEYLRLSPRSLLEPRLPGEPSAG